MSKQSIPVREHYCPQALFLYGTDREDGSANFGLFCWFTYCWNNRLQAIASIGDNKLTKDLIKRNGVFSANLVTEKLLPYADYCGHRPGYDGKKEKMTLATERGQVLDVPVLVDSPCVFELKVDKNIPLEGESELFLCNIENALVNEELLRDPEDMAGIIARIRPALTVKDTYSSLGAPIAPWGTWKESLS